MIYLYLFGTCFHFIYVFIIIGKYLCDDEDNVPLIKENIETKPPITLYKP